MRSLTAVIGLSLATLIQVTISFIQPTSAVAAGSSTLSFVIDASNTSNFSTTGSNVNSSISESANGVSGNATSVSLQTTSPSPAFVFNGSSSMIFANNVKPDLTNGLSIQFVAKLNNSYTSGSWPRVIDFGETTGWGGGYDNMSIQLGWRGSVEMYVSKSGVSGSNFCGSSDNTVALDTFAIYSIQVGAGTCSIAVNGSAASVTTNESTNPFAARVPGTSSTWTSRIGVMINGNSPLNGRIRTMIISTGSAATNAVVFMPNGGAGYTPSQIGSSIVNLNSSQYSRSGYEFSGWNTNSDGSGTSYSNGATFNLATASRMLFAQWSIPAPSLALPQLASATYRTTYPINLTINTSGRYTFYDTGKRIPGCIGIIGTPPTVTCNWRPSKIGSYSISATGKVGSLTYFSNSSRVMVFKRTILR